MKLYFSTGGITVRLMRDVRKKDPNSECPLKWCVTYKRKREYYSTGKTLDSKNWNLFEVSEEPDFNFKTKALHLKEFKNDIQKYFEETLKPTVKSLSESFSFEVLNELLGKSDIVTVNDAFTAKINDLIEDNKIGNSEIYQTTYNALQRFKNYKTLKGKKKSVFLQKCIEFKNVTKGENKITVEDKQIRFDEITPQFLKECERFWRETDVSSSTIAMRMRTIRSIVRNENKPFLAGNQYPFGGGKYLIPASTRREVFFPIEAIWKLENYETEHPILELARDVFVFMFYGNGMNFKDLCLLKYSDITFDKELRFFREKTNTGSNEQPINVPLLPPLIEIINRWGNKEQDGYIFQFLNGVDENDEAEIKRRNRRDLETINSNLKVMAAELDLNTDISTNWARHSYMTHLLSEEMLNETVVRQMVGHSTRKDVTAGYNHLTPKKRREINAKLLNPGKKYNTLFGAASNFL